MSQTDDPGIDPTEPEDLSEDGTLAPRQDGAAPVPSQEIAAAMTVQAEILKRLHQSQNEIQEALARDKRGEMMIQSTRALNDSFRGMQKTQEKLLDRLDEESARPKRTAWYVGGAAVIVALAIGLTGLFVTDAVRETGAELKAGGMDERSAAALAELERIGARLDGLESTDRETFQSELRALRGRVSSLSEERARLVVERDALREERGRLLERFETTDERIEAAEDRVRRAEDRARNAEDQADRLAKGKMADQELVAKLSSTIEALRAAQGRVLPAGEGGAATAAETNGGEPGATPATGPSEERPASAGSNTPAERAADDAFVTLLNDLLTKHRSSNSYTLVSVRGFDDEGLLGIALEERGADGSLSKTLHAERLRFRLGRTGRTLNLGFEKGHIVYRRRGRDIESPFFKNTYDLVVFGVETTPWMNAGLPFGVGP